MASQFFAESIGSHPPRFGGQNEHDYLDQFHGGAELAEYGSFFEALQHAEVRARKNCTVAYAVERRAPAHGSNARPVVRWRGVRYNCFSHTFELGKEARNGACG